MALNLTERGTHESENPIELSLREAFEFLKPQLNPPFTLKVLTQEEYSNLNKAIIFGILTQPHLAKVHIKHLHAINTDGYCFFTCMLIKIVDEIYVKLVDSVKIQLMWVTKEMLNVLAIGFDKLLVALLRQIISGDFSEGNLWLCLEMVTIFLANWDCLLEEEPSVLNKGLYVFLRLLTDHYRVQSNPMMDALKRMEVEFCVRLLREQFSLCLKIGRDLIRLLQDLVHIPEFKMIWKELLLHPGQFRAEGFEDISQIYRTKTPSSYFLLRITPEMETKLRFLLTHVKFGSQKRYQVWFAKKFLGVPERETVLIDIVRFICCSVHASSEITQPDILPRWAVIGWLLKSCRKSYVEANLKLALFYDWLFFDETTDNVMNIEPAILLMVNSIPKYIDVTHTLLEFLLIVVGNYDIERKEMISKGVSTALSALVKKGIVGSLDVLTRCDLIATVLREMLGKLVLVMQGTHSKNLGPSSIIHDMSPPPFHFLSSSSGSQHPKRAEVALKWMKVYKEKFKIKVIGSFSRHNELAGVLTIPRQVVGGNLAADQQEVLLSTSKLLQAILDVISSNGWLNLALLAMETSQMITQGVWERDSRLLQLPHFTKELAKRCQGNPGKSIETVFDLVEMDENERRELLQMSESLLMDIYGFCNQYPDIDLTYDVLDGGKVRAGDDVTLQVTLERNLEGRTEVGPVFAPRYPKDKEEGWWLVVGDPKSNQLLAIKRVTLQRKSRIKLNFTTPAEAGTREYTLYFMCDSYLGCDEEHTFALDVKEAMAEDNT